MSSDPAQREQEIFAGALQLAPEARPVYLAAVCAGDAALRARVESLLRHHEESGGILDRTDATGMLESTGAGGGLRRSTPWALWALGAGLVALLVGGVVWLLR